MIKVGNVAIGGDSPISIQSMTNTDTRDFNSTLGQIRVLDIAGCEIVRIAVPDLEAAQVLPELIPATDLPIIADIHFDYKLALEAIKAGISGLRINPGNIGSEQKVLKVIEACRERKIPIRIGVNSGSIPKEMLKKYGHTAQALVESALYHVGILENVNYQEIKISVKASSVNTTIDAYRLLAKKVDYPLHLGVTEAGTVFRGTIKSCLGIGTLLAEGIGDTIRVSLTANPVEEIRVAKEILKSLDLRQGLDIISCPTCGRTEIDIIKLTEEIETKLEKYRDKNITVAIMGCIVNGPGEASEADYGIAGGKKEGLLFKRGKILKKVPEKNLVQALLDLIKTDAN